MKCRWTDVINVLYFEDKKKKPWLAKKSLRYLRNLKPFKTYFCGETLGWINVLFSEVKSFFCVIIRIFPVSEHLGQASVTIIWLRTS